MTLTRFALCWALLGMFLPHALAQSQLPAPSRTIYKCQVKGTVSYSDEPCVGAQRLDIVPSRGADRLSGSRRVGNDVASEIRSEQFAQAVKPLTGMSPTQFAAASRRHYMDTASRSECRQLEAAILTSEQVERSAGAGMMEAIRQDLFSLRKRYKQLGC
jgi:hypothetical protein